MAEVTLMLRSKETDNKQRWAADVNGVEFKLYIPKHRIPDPFPPSIVVRISPATGAEPRALLIPTSPFDASWHESVNTRRRCDTVRSAMQDYLRYARRLQLKQLSGHVRIQDNWQELEAAELESQRDTDGIGAD